MPEQEYPNEEVAEFAESDHRLAGAIPFHQPDDDDDDPHRLAGAVPAEQPDDAPRDANDDPVLA